jgi:perilipin-2
LENLDITFCVTAPISANDDPVLHTVQTVGRLSNKVASRVYRTVSTQVKSLKKEDLHEYIASLIAVLRLTEYLNFINDKLHPSSATITELPVTSKAVEVKKVK